MSFDRLPEATRNELDGAPPNSLLGIGRVILRRVPDHGEVSVRDVMNEAAPHHTRDEEVFAWDAIMALVGRGLVEIVSVPLRLRAA